MYDAFAKGDVQAVLAAMHDDVQWHEPESLPYGNQVGPQAVAQNIFAKVLEDISGFAAAPQEFVDGGDIVVSIGTYSGQGARTGKRFDMPFVHVWRFRDGKISGFRTYTDTKLWLEALGR